MKKKSAHKLIHPSFPDQGSVQPAHMGSQSATPDINLQMSGPQGPSNLPMDYSSNMSPNGEY